MPFALIDAAAAPAVPLTLVTPETVASTLSTLPEAQRQWAGANGFRAEAGSLMVLPGSTGAIAGVLVGWNPSEPIWAVGGLSEALPAGSYALATALPRDPASRVALGWAMGAYAFARYKRRSRASAELVWPAETDRAEVERLARGICLARDLINTPAEEMGPAELAGAAETIARERGASCKVLVGDALLQNNYPMIHAVGRGSARAPRLIDLTWGDPAAPKVTLVGKGVCFDSGGLDLKTAQGMRMMKKDMGGAATLLGLASVIMEAGLPVRLRLLIPAVENFVSGTSFRPLDVIRTRKGLTVEVGNTDAEGRLILCDALAEADSEQPALLIDAATLTGAARVALGPDLPALFTHDDGLAAALLAAGSAESDPFWRMPLWRPYRKLLESKVADLNNVSESGFAGAVVAALYLADFVAPTTPWAHIDTYAWNAATRPGRPEGGEALGLRALYAAIKAKFAPVR
ncbi:MAG TPA: leucyl aminopeptidase family protein [Stellaceae bacterium]|nr:leucyl aminopeptidase family protein [Stellaceae bacterium]